MNVIELFHKTSTNGRWGLVVLGEEDTKFPAEGRIEFLGTVAGKATYRFIEGPTGQWIYVGGDVKVHGGGTVIESMDLQSGDSVSLLVLGPEAVIEEFGYKGRSSSIRAYFDGERQNIPDTVLLAMGLLRLSPKEDEKVKAFTYEAPPALENSMADALSNWRRS